MRPLGLVLLAAAGRGRTGLVVGCTALSTALLLVAVSMLRLYGDDGYAMGVIGPIADPGTRGGAVFGVVLLVLPVLLLLDQAVRLGSSARERRYAALAVAGATRSDLRRWGVVEVGLPATAGALLGVPVWLVLRWLLGVQLGADGKGLVPTTVGPGWWALPLMALVAAYGALVGMRVGARSGRPLGRSRGVRRPPRPWGLLVLGLAVVVLVGGSFLTAAALLLGLALVVVGLAVLSPWLAYRVALLFVGRVSSAAQVLALRRLVADPGPAGRAAAATGAVALSGGVIGPLIGAVLAENDYGGASYYVGPALLAGLLAAIASLFVAGALAVHSTETMLERRRELAALAATGVPTSTIAGSQRLEIWVATLPLATGASLVGAFGYWARASYAPVLWPVLSVVVTLLVVTGSGALATLLVRPWLRDAVRPVNLRTE